MWCPRRIRGFPRWRVARRKLCASLNERHLPGGSIPWNADSAARPEDRAVCIRDRRVGGIAVARRLVSRRPMQKQAWCAAGIVLHGLAQCADVVGGDAAITAAERHRMAGVVHQRRECPAACQRGHPADQYRLIRNAGGLGPHRMRPRFRVRKITLARQRALAAGPADDRGHGARDRLPERPPEARDGAWPEMPGSCRPPARLELRVDLRHGMRVRHDQQQFVRFAGRTRHESGHTAPRPSGTTGTSNSRSSQ